MNTIIVHCLSPSFFRRKESPIKWLLGFWKDLAHGPTNHASRGREATLLHG